MKIGIIIAMVALALGMLLELFLSRLALIGLGGGMLGRFSSHSFEIPTRRSGVGAVVKSLSLVPTSHATTKVSRQAIMMMGAGIRVGIRTGLSGIENVRGE